MHEKIRHSVADIKTSQDHIYMKSSKGNALPLTAFLTAHTKYSHRLRSDTRYWLSFVDTIGTNPLFGRQHLLRVQAICKCYSFVSVFYRMPDLKLRSPTSFSVLDDVYLSLFLLFDSMDRLIESPLTTGSFRRLSIGQSVQVWLSTLGILGIQTVTANSYKPHRVQWWWWETPFLLVQVAFAFYVQGGEYSRETFTLLSVRTNATR